MDIDVKDKNKILEMYDACKNRAEVLLKDPYKLKYDLDNAFKKVNSVSKGPIVDMIEDIKVMINLVKDYVSGEYKEIPLTSVIGILGGIIYFISPVDLIPEFLPGGLVDDFFILALSLKQAKFEIDKYKEWKNTFETE